MPSVTPAYWSDTFRRGADYERTIPILSAGATGSPVNLVGSVVTITVRRRDGTVATYASTDTSPKVTHNGAGGVVTFILSESDTVSYPAGGHEFELKATLASGDTNVYLVGTLAGEG